MFASVLIMSVPQWRGDVSNGSGFMSISRCVKCGCVFIVSMGFDYVGYVRLDLYPV